VCRYRLGRAKSPEGQKSSDEESGDKSTSHFTDKCKKITATVAEAATSKASSATDCKNVPTNSCDKKTASDKEAAKSETTMSKNSDTKQKKDIDDSQLTDEGKR